LTCNSASMPARRPDRGRQRDRSQRAGESQPTDAVQIVVP
jgi:hypothetical protein